MKSLVAAVALTLATSASALTIPQFHVLSTVDGKQSVVEFTTTANAKINLDRDGYYIIGRNIAIQVLDKVYRFTVFEFQGLSKAQISDYIKDAVKADIKAEVLSGEITSEIAQSVADAVAESLADNSDAIDAAVESVAGAVDSALETYVDNILANHPIGDDLDIPAADLEKLAGSVDKAIDGVIERAAENGVELTGPYRIPARYSKLWNR